MWYDPPAGLFTVEGENMLRAKRDRLASAIAWWANARPKPRRSPEHKALSERCILAEDRVVAMEQERAALKAEIDVLKHERHAERQRVDKRDQDVARLREALEQARLTLASEQGTAEGAPSEGWSYDRRYRQWGKPRGLQVRKIGSEWAWQVSPNPTGKSWRGQEPTARAAMLTADKALFESRRTRCLAKVRQLQSDGVILYPPNGTHQQTPAIMIDRLSDPDLTEAVLATYEQVLFQ